MRIKSISQKQHWIVYQLLPLASELIITILNCAVLVSITSSNTKSFIVYRWVKNKPERITLGRYPDLTIEQARRKATEVNADIAKGENPNDKRRADRVEMTFEKLFSEYVERHSKIHKKSWKEDNAQYKRYLNNWGKRKISHIERGHIQKLHHEIGHEKGHYAANRLLALLRTVFNKAKEFGLWDKSNPTEGIKKFRETSRDRFLQSNELPRFFKALSEESNETFRDCFFVALLTGARRANVQAMKWEEINLESREWRIPDTKNKTPHTITLTDEVIIVLQRRKVSSTNPFVFPGIGSTGHLVEPKKGWQRILTRAGITDLRFHDLRRTLGSWQVRTGASLAIIGKSLNHKSPQATAIYARLDLDPVRESVEKATKAMFSAAGISLTEKKDGIKKQICV